MGLRSWFSGKNKATSINEDASGNSAHERSAQLNVPAKVYITKDGPGQYNDLYFFDDQMSKSLMHGYYAPSNFMELYYAVPELQWAVNERARRVASGTWQLLKDWNDENDYSNKQFNRLFSQPNPFQTITDLIFVAEVYYCLLGKTFLNFNIPSSLPVELGSVNTINLLPADKVMINKKKNADYYTANAVSDLIENYTIPDSRGGTRTFGANRVLPLLNPNLLSNNDVSRTAGLVLGAELAIKNLIPVYQARGAIYIRRGALGFVVSQKVDDSGAVSLTPSEKKSLNDEFMAANGVTAGKNTVVVTSTPVKFERTSMSIKEMEPFEETLQDAIIIAAELGIPGHLVPRKDQSTYANASTEVQNSYDDVFIPRAQVYADAITAFLNLQEINRRYLHVDFSGRAALQENKKERAQTDNLNSSTWERRFKNSAATLNQWIISTGEKRVVDPLFDKYILQMTPEEIEKVSSIINIKSTNAVQQQSPNNAGTAPTA